MLGTFFIFKKNTKLLIYHIDYYLIGSENRIREYLRDFSRSVRVVGKCRFQEKIRGNSKELEYI